MSRFTKKNQSDFVRTSASRFVTNDLQIGTGSDVYEDKVEWEWVVDVLGNPTNIMPNAICSTSTGLFYGSYIMTGDENIYKYTTGSHASVHSQDIGGYESMYYCVNTNSNLIIAGGYKTSSNPIMVSNDLGATFSAVQTIGNDHIRDCIEYNWSGTWYPILVLSGSNDVYYSTNLGASWSNIATYNGTSPRKACVFKNKLYIGDNDGSVNVFNDVDAFGTAITPEGTEVRTMVNYNDEYMYIGYNSKNLYKWNGVDAASLVTTLTQVPYGSCHYTDLIYFHEYSAYVERLNPLTDTIIDGKNFIGSGGTFTGVEFAEYNNYLHTIARDSVSGNYVIVRHQRGLE